MKKIIFLLVYIGFLSSALSQTRKPLTIDDLTKWNRITGSSISVDGSLAGFVIEPWDGDPVIKLYGSNADEIVTFNSASGLMLTSDSRFMIFIISTIV